MNKLSAIDQGEVSTTRLEALTDGIFAVAMTLLVFEIRLPETGQTGDVLGYVIKLWPNFLSFVISFIVLGMFWVGHHTEFRYVKRLDHTLIWLNIFYLLFISLVPFSAGLLGRYASTEGAIMIYGIHLIILVLVQYIIWRHARSNNLIDPLMDPQINIVANRLGYFAIAGYVGAILLSFINWRISLGIYTLIPIPYILGIFYRVK